MSTRKIHILFVEDLEIDMELALKELKKENVECIWSRVDTRIDLEKQLIDFKPDLIIADYSMPSFSGLEALQIVQEFNPDLPVILFTGSVNEETAVTCMKAGATDYVLKDKIKRLPFAIREALAQKESKRAEKAVRNALLESEGRYRLFMDSTTDMAFLKDEKFRYILVNKANQKFLNRPEEEIVGKTDFDLMDQGIATNCRNSDLEAIQQGNIHISRETIGNCTYETTKFPVVMLNGSTGIGGFIRDITQQVEAEKLLRLQGAALNAAANAIIITDVNGTILSVNPAFSKLTGYSAEEAIGHKNDELTYSGFMTEEEKEKIRHSIQNGITWTGEMINRRKDGTFYNEEVTITPVYDSEGKIAQIVSIRQDITERKVAELAIEASERKFRQLVENAMIGIYTSTMEGTFVQVNDPLCQILECASEEELLSIKIESFYKDPAERKVLLDSLIMNGKLLNHEVELVTKQGHKKDVIVNAILEGSNILGMVMDITDRKQNEKELLVAKDRAEESDRLKSSFLANMSHEVRTPMNAIHGYAELLLSPEYTQDEKSEYIGIVKHSSQQLLKIMNNIVEISKITANQITDNPTPLVLNSLLKEICDEYARAAEDKKLTMSLSYGLPDEASRINFDDLKLKNIIGNLLDNAVKFTEKGTIEIGYSLKDSILEFYVSDSGIGIDQENLEIIFQNFRQLEDAHSRKFSGSGLGLPIAKALVEFLGGKIWVKSKPGEGSVFYFNIPFIPVEVQDKQKKETVNLEDNFSDFTILVAEDDEINFVYMERLLSKTEANILRAANGQEAVDICSSGYPVDLILMDINMPFMNGLEATKIIKSQNPKLPVIAVTAYSISGDRETCLAAGCNDYIPKPIRREELMNKLNNLLSR